MNEFDRDLVTLVGSCAVFLGGGVTSAGGSAGGSGFRVDIYAADMSIKLRMNSGQPMFVPLHARA